MGSRAKDVLAELNEIGVMGGKVLPLPFVTRPSTPEQPNNEELQEKLAHLGKSFSKILEKLDSLEGDVLGLKEAFKSAAEIWSGSQSEEECDDPESDGEADEDETDEGGEGESGAGEDGQETSNSD
jgi:hypothetical protein